MRRLLSRNPGNFALTRAGAGLLVGFILILGILHAISQFIVPGNLFTQTDRYIDRVFDLNQEQNVPAWYASILWFLVFQVAVLNFIFEWKIRSRKAHRWVWLLFAVLFLGASVDEVATIHEHVGSYLQDEVIPQIRGALATMLVRHGWSGTSALVSFATSRSPWVLFYAPVLVGVGGFCWIFLWRRLHPNRELQWLMIAAAACYLTAESFDFIQGVRAIPVSVVQRPLGLDWGVFLELTVMIEEMLEDLGTVLIIVALFEHLRIGVRQHIQLVADST